MYNSSGYEEVSSLKLLKGLADHSSRLSAEYSQAPDYFQKASAAISEMFRQTGPPILDLRSGLMKRGTIVRHLLLPGETADSKRILRYLHDTYQNDIYVSILNQYTPPTDNPNLPEALRRPVSSEEYEKVLAFADAIGIEQGYLQEGDTADESFIPAFDFSGL